jgi:hypothetical protein
MCTMVEYTLEGYIYQEYTWDQSQLRFLSIAANIVCCKDSKFQVSIYVGPIRDKTYENLHHYTHLFISLVAESNTALLAALGSVPLRGRLT